MVKVGQLGITSSNLRQDADMPLAHLDQLSVEQILVMIEQVVQSNKNFWLFEGIEIHAIHSHMPGGGDQQKTVYLWIDFILRLRNVSYPFKIKTICTLRGLMVAMAHFNKDHDPKTFKHIT